MAPHTLPAPWWVRYPINILGWLVGLGLFAMTIWAAVLTKNDGYLWAICAGLVPTCSFLFLTPFARDIVIAYGIASYERGSVLPFQANLKKAWYIYRVVRGNSFYDITVLD